MRGVFFSIEEFGTFGAWRWCSRRIVLESNLIVNVKQLAFGEAGNKFFCHKFHKFSQIRTRTLATINLDIFRSSWLILPR